MKNISKFLFCGLFSFLWFGFVTNVSAVSINKITMDVYIDSNGNANITEIWNAYVDSGTEGYKPYGNLGNSEITDFTVKDDSGKVYTYQEYWDVNGDFAAKKYKNGKNRTSSGIELCWGISEYGSRTYTLNYKITNFVNQYNDSQGIYFSLMPKEMNQSPGSVVITIRSEYEFNKENTKIWAFGYYGGNINFDNGTIVMNSNGPLARYSYMTTLIKITDGTFNTTNIVNKSFNDVYEEAMSDVDKSEKNSKLGIGNYLFMILMSIIYIVFNPITIAIVIYIVLKRRGFNWSSVFSTDSNVLDFGPDGKNLPSDDIINYYRDIPCNKDLARAYWVAYQYSVCSINECREGIIGAILLKWVKQGYITVCKTKKGLFSFKDNNYAIDLNNLKNGDNEVENKLLELLKKASGNNNILESKEFEKWCKRNYYQIEQWFDSIITYETNVLEQQGMITISTKEIPGIFGKMRTVKTKTVYQTMKNEAIQLKGLKKFLLDFSIIAQREHLEVKIWEEYLIFAQLLGIADKVEEQFSKLYPNFNQLSKLNIELTTVAIRNMAYIGYEGVKAGREKADASRSNSDYSSGDGGSSYSDGGSSAGGSSDGGGFR